MRHNFRILGNMLLITGGALLIFALLPLDVIPNHLIVTARKAGQAVDRSEVELDWLNRAFHAAWSGLTLLIVGGISRVAGRNACK
jgi:hypothetical protein